MFEIRQCTHPDCGLRMPIDPTVHKGDFCPRCGAPMLKASAPFQHQGSEHSSVVPKRRICILLDNIRSTHNVGAIFRTADGVGARHLYLCGYTPSPSDNSAIQKTALGAEITLSWSQHLNALALAQNLQQGHYLLVLKLRQVHSHFMSTWLRWVLSNSYWQWEMSKQALTPVY